MLWWKKKEKPLREQLIEARDKLRRQIETLHAGPASLGRGGEFIDNSALESELTSALRRIEQTLAELDQGA
jgi:hypothetical protein